ncbi:PREDICTED: chondroitin sulfate proteoglycan 4-like [Amphimedon queenslandica]|uniref:Cadherin domain-containing protein n=1 Tax=Amphimedon queenslandica TaxID=400682 RepID=A0A1X7VCV9_AMPQE|nr:PREDICTED: chondroitin sulfate proteoglycan 4-like [Amphimedon queenslandica]|eukprot:XP_019849585.1 PREDICTED: chondroitin sulfate proteoglycan 4-like [Amphimedon queenslandica]
MKRERRTVSVFYCIRTYSLLLLLLALTVRGDDSNNQSITIPIASGTKSLLHFNLLTTHLSPSLSDDDVVFHLATSNCSICTPSGRVAGQLEGPTGSPLSRFSMQQLKDDGVYFQHYLEAGLDPALISLFITTPTNPSINQSLVINVSPFNGIIESLAEPRLLVREDGSVLISAQHLRVGTNFETQTPELMYSIQSIARHGSLELWESDSWTPLSNGSSFTQSQVDTLQLRYRQSGPVVTDLVTDSVSLLVSSSQLEGPEVSLIIFIMSSSFSSSPSLSANTTSLSVQEGGSSLFRKDSLFFSFSPSSIESGSLSYPLSHDDFDISLTVASLPTRGSLILNNGSSEYTLSLHSVFNYQDMVSQKLTYVHDGSDTTFDSLSFLVNIASLYSDAFNVSESSFDIDIDVHITPVNDNAPSLKQLRYINPLEGSYVILNESFFKITDPDQLPFDYLIRVDEGSAEDGNGHFAEVNKGLDQKIREFKMSQVISHDIVYVYRELDPAHILSYNHSVTIFDGLYTVKQQLKVSVIPLSISVSTNIASNSLCLLTADLLFSTNPPTLSSDHFIIDITLPERMSEVTVSIVKQPLRGYLRESESPTLLTSYSYSSTNNIIYTVNDTLTQETSDIFRLQFSLGHGRSQLVDVGVCIKPLPYLSLMNQTSFTVLATSEFVIMPDNLNVVQTRFNVPYQIRYRLKSIETDPEKLSPVYGEIRDVSTNEVLTEFTQHDINSQKVMYVSFNEHPISTEFEDKIYLEVTNGYYTLPKFTISAFVTQNVLNVTRKGFRVTEGEGEHIISKEEFYVEPLEGYETSIYILQYPQFGSLILRRPSPAPEIVGPRHFNLQDITEGYLIYEYDDKNEEQQDFFYFYFVLRNKNNSDYKDFRGILSISIDPINDNTPHCSANNQFIVPEGCEKQITSEHITCFDSDRPPNDNEIKLTLLHFPHLFGQLCVGDRCSNSTSHGFALTWADILSGRFTFRAGDQSIPVYASFNVKDELHQGNVVLFEIDIQSTVAHRNATGSVSVIENSHSFIGSSVISYTTDCSKSIAPSDILYSISTLPKYGRVLKHGLPINIANNSYHFTQEDINSQGVVYEQDGSNVETDFFNVSVQILSFREDDVLISVNTTTIDDDPPTLDITRVLFVGNGTVADIHRSILSMKDLDTTDPSKLVYHVISSSSGKIELHRHDRQNYLETDSFTQQDINGNLVRYKHDLLTAWSDTIVLCVSDGINDQPNNYTLRVIIASNTIIETVVDGAALMEGGNVTVDPTSVTIKHPYFSTAAGTVTVLQGVSSGHLKLDGEDCGSNCSFSLDKLRNQNLVYYHDGTETFHDSFVFEIHWETPYHTNELEYSFDIQPINDERPHIINNTLFNIYVTKTNPLNASYLASVDSDTPPHLLWYNFNIDVRDRSEGYFALNGTEQDSFTQADIDNGLVSFVDKRKYEGFPVSLNFTVSDGFHVTSGVFKILPKIVKIRVSNASVSVPMGGSVVISTEFLSASTNQDDKIDPNSISYTLADPKYGIKYGRLSLVSSPLAEVISFNQSQVSNGELLYTHTAVDVWEPAERVALILYHPLALDIEEIVLIINISLPSTPNTTLAVKKELRLRENDMICLNQSLLDARNIRYQTWKKMNQSTSDPPGLYDLSPLFHVLHPPSHGSLLLNDSSDFSMRNFTQTELLTGSVCYSNGGSEKHNDSFIIQVQVVDSRGTVYFTSPPETVNIAIELYNDELPYLNASLQLTKSIVEGFRSLITRSDLHVIDEDNEPQRIYYSVSNLTSGSLVLGADSSTPVFTFTQADINAGRLVYVPGEVGVAYFNFSFVDEEGTTGGQEYRFTLNISSFSFNVNFNDLAILQTHTFALITANNLETVTNGNPLLTRFNVTTLPSNGKILVSETASSEFSQLDVDEGRVKYSLFDTSHYKDVMSVDAVNNDIKISFNISVSVVLDGSANDAVLNLTNASSVLLPHSLFDIHLMSYDLPVIKITSELQYGYFSRKLPNIGMGSKRITEFNYEDLKSNSIYYNFEPTSSIIDSNGVLYEQITGIVTVRDLSPGEFHLTLTLIHNHLSTTTSVPSSTLSPTNEPVGTNRPSTGTIEAAFYIPLSALVVLILILLIIIVLFCFCQSRIIKLKLAKGLAGSGDVAKGGFLPPHSSLSYKVADPPYYSTASPHFSSRGGGEGEIDDISDSLSNVSGADIMMVRHPISSSHTHLPYHQDIGYHSHSVDEAIGAGGYMDSVGPPVQRRPLETPPFFSSPHADQYCIDSVPRSRSPLRRPSSLRQNPRPYSSRSSLGRVSPVKPPHFHAPLNFSRPESASSMGYDSSCITEDRHSRPSSVNTSLRVDEVCNSQYEDSTRCTTPAAAPNTNAIALKDQQYWV